MYFFFNLPLGNRKVKFRRTSPRFYEFLGTFYELVFYEAIVQIFSNSLCILLSYRRERERKKGEEMRVLKMKSCEMGIWYVSEYYLAINSNFIWSRNSLACHAAHAAPASRRAWLLWLSRCCCCWGVFLSDDHAFN